MPYDPTVQSREFPESFGQSPDMGPTGIRTLTLEDVRNDLAYMLDALACDVKAGRYESARQSAEIIVNLTRAAERLAYSVPPVREISAREAYGV